LNWVEAFRIQLVFFMALAQKIVKISLIPLPFYQKIASLDS
jgi:hypothetical protein